MAGELTYWMGETRTVEREREGLREALIDAVNAFTSNSVTYVAQVSYERFMRWAAALAAPSRPQAPETAPETGEEAAVEDRARGLLRNAVTMAEQGAFVGDNVDRWLTNVYIALAYDRGAVRRAATPAQAPETGEEAQLAATMCGHCSADAAIRPAYRFCPMCGEPCVVAE